MKFIILILTAYFGVSCSSLPEGVDLKSIQNKYTETSDLLVLQSKNRTPTIGFIFYPGAFVDPHAYLKWQDKLIADNQDVKIFTVKMPANLAVLAAEKGYDLLNSNPEIKVWFAAGHSLGGTMAAQLVSNHVSEFKGLVFIASYPANNALETWNGAVLSIYASKDGLSTLDDIEFHKKDLPTAYVLKNQNDFILPLQSKTNYFNIVGGNHAQFGNYGLQAKDSVADITSENQQSQLIQVLNNFISLL